MMGELAQEGFTHNARIPSRGCGPVMIQLLKQQEAEGRGELSGENPSKETDLYIQDVADPHHCLGNNL